MSYQPQSPYLPQYYPPAPAQVHMVSPARPEMAQRKRPKYTRSKTGCMTCRVKKIKCDETKPMCMRCTHGSRECTWPEGVPARKKPVARKDSIDGRPSTASSSVSDGSTPPTREHTPPRRLQLDLSLMPSPRPTTDTFLHMHSDHDSRRPIDRSYQPQNVLSIIPEASYGTRYDPTYSSYSRQSLQPAYRPMPSSHWSNQPEALESYYSTGLQERTLLGHGSSHDHAHNRYQ